MFETNHTAEDPTVALSDEVAEFIPWRVVELRVLPGYQLYQRFADGIEGRVKCVSLYSVTMRAFLSHCVIQPYLPR